MSRHRSIRPRRLIRPGHGVGLGGEGVDLLVAVLGPVPAAGHGTAAAQNGPVEVGRVREVRDPGHAARPHHRRGAVAAGRDHGRLRQRLDLGLDADRREVLLDGLRDARVGIGVHGVELGLEAVRMTGLGEQVLGFLGVVRIALVVRRRTLASPAATAGWPPHRGH